MNLNFNKRKWWYFKNNKSIHIEIAGWSSTPSIYLRVDGDEAEVTFHLAFGFGIWIAFERFLPESWYPSYESKHGNGTIPDEKEISLAIHGGCFWWNFWVSEEDDKTWRKGCFHFSDKIKGKHVCERKEVDRRQFILPFLEGNYNVEVIKYDRLDRWPRWPAHRMTSWEVRAGYYKDDRHWVEKGIPVEGKGENSWDCDEDATYSSSFPGPPFNKQVKTPYEAALYFWHSMMKSRERYGSPKWTPQAFNKELEIIK